MSLPENWVNKIFSKLAATYGQSFHRMYDGVDLEDVKANWAEELAGFGGERGSAIAYALKYLPSAKAPTVLEFRDICRKAPDSKPLSLPAPTEPADPAVIAQARKALKPITNTGNKDWAYALKRRHESGEKLTRFQIDCYRETLGIVPQEAA